MSTTFFFQKIKSYYTLTAEAEKAWTGILHEKVYHKGDYLAKKEPYEISLRNDSDGVQYDEVFNDNSV